ncbi:hypothetical protein EOE18_05290 [Novosphingobium umbonatum]|uniref:Uncharacterized protein n=1 Tax=Novosphingobium umbonatum TaxID=1908524 RepID=A0A437N8J2_9SPHN|nr:hypothetical protein [Novosphingobium umbonatum]RVU06253.1 hypothetical protein EOE18_05290 [Novosphingobium umbonatum]
MMKASPSISLRMVMLAWVSALGLMQVLLWRYLGLGWGWFAASGGALVALLLLIARQKWTECRIDRRVFAVALPLSVLLLVLGGEGGLFYATPDWQVRYAVLHDLATQPWPFAFAHHGGPLILRLPLGMYLLPGLVGQYAGFSAACWALLVQNSLLLTGLIAMGSALFEGARRQWVALGSFLGFSGMDVLGQWVAGKSLALHLEGWAGVQFSSTITQIFWVPQHAMAGWVLALAYLLWWRGLVPLAVLVAAMPLVALLSPLAMIGGLPFVAYAGGVEVWRRKWLWHEFLAGALALVACGPALLYLTAGSGAVKQGAAQSFQITGYPIFILLEISAYCLALWRMKRQQPFGIDTRWIAVLALLVVPCGQIGDGVDFAMRASIPALAILALSIGHALGEPQPWAKEAKGWIMVALVFGIATPAGEIWRAVTWQAATPVLCGYLGVIRNGYATYTAPWAALPEAIRSSDTQMVVAHNPYRCWSKPWRDPVSGEASFQHPY